MKTTKILSILLVSGICSSAFAQSNSNLNFSETKETPKQLSKIAFAKEWSNPNRGTADLFSKEGNRTTGIPNNQVGEQDAFSGGAYAGIIAFMDDAVTDWKELVTGEGDGEKKGYNKYTEYVQTKLTQPLVAGQAYNISFRANLAEKSGRAINNLGLLLSKEAVSNNSNSFITATPQIKSENVLDNKTEWAEISGRFVAEGGEQFLTIGLFNGVDQSVDLSKETNNRRAYYYIDGIAINVFDDPDTDGDGVTDKNDACPNVKGLAAFKGCPDTDGDGIADSKDACPNVKGLAEHSGCPDTDGDGIIDSKDSCPNVKGLVAFNGCLEKDTDGDGIVDSKDACPNVKGIAKYDGCLLSKEEKKVIEDASAHIYFETGSSTIKKVSYPDLDRLAAILKKHPEVKARVEGHTDSSGNAEKNLALSKDRAASVKKYLIEHGEKEDHITSEGYGSSIPVASNDTKAGRAKNRRVGIVVSSFEKVEK
jgi:outer membrane protein OmpA-like peptidoglycan-associated protein